MIGEEIGQEEIGEDSKSLLTFFKWIMEFNERDN